MTLYLHDELATQWQNQDVFSLLARLDGKVYREVKGRRTLQFNLDGSSYFLKYHDGTGWKEIVKNLVRLRLPIFGARNEWRAIQKLKELGIDTMTLVGYGQRGWNPAAFESFVITRELEDTVNLEDLCAGWSLEKPSFRLKQSLLGKVAAISRRMHQAGICHRDYYLCHFHVPDSISLQDGDNEIPVYLIDLHRALIKQNLARRWIVKDIAGLYFSSMEIGLTKRDLLRFVRAYRNAPLRQTLEQDRKFWNEVVTRGRNLYEKLGNPRRTTQ